jgi:hypothetical protein
LSAIAIFSAKKIFDPYKSFLCLDNEREHKKMAPKRTATRRERSPSPSADETSSSQPTKRSVFQPTTDASSSVAAPAPLAAPHAPGDWVAVIRVAPGEDAGAIFGPVVAVSDATAASSSGAAVGVDAKASKRAKGKKAAAAEEEEEQKAVEEIATEEVAQNVEDNSATTAIAPFEVKVVLKAGSAIVPGIPDSVFSADMEVQTRDGVAYEAPVVMPYFQRPMTVVVPVSIVPSAEHHLKALQASADASATPAAASTATGKGKKKESK